MNNSFATVNKVIGFFVIFTIILGYGNYAFSQEIGLATFQETAQIIIDKTISQNVTASITIQSTSIQEVKIPSELEQRIRENTRISSVVLTNQNQCVLGVENESCILINVKRNLEDKNFLDIQNSTLTISNQFIEQINETFDTKAELHSTFIHGSDESNLALETSGVVSGKGTVSATYTMPMEDTSSMYEKMSAMLIPKVIRDSGGFYEIAQNLAAQENSKFTLSIIPMDNKSLMQLKLSIDYPNTANLITEINPLEFLQTYEIKRSEYFSSGFYPLNSIIQVVILSPEETNISDIKGDIIPSQTIDGQKIPIEVTKSGWVFDPDKGTKIQGRYIFGESESVQTNDLIFTIGEDQIKTEKQEVNFDESIIVVIIITVGAVAAAIFYLKGYRK